MRTYINCTMWLGIYPRGIRVRLCFSIRYTRVSSLCAINQDIVKAPEGRCIGDVHDKSAPTDVWGIVVISKIGGYGFVLNRDFSEVINQLLYFTQTSLSQFYFFKCLFLSALF